MCVHVCDIEFYMFLVTWLDECGTVQHTIMQKHNLGASFFGVKHTVFLLGYSLF